MHVNPGGSRAAAPPGLRCQRFGTGRTCPPTRPPARPARGLRSKRPEGARMPYRSGTVQANGVRLAYEEVGDPQDPAILLIMGLGAQLGHWPEPLVDGLAAGGFRVIRYDNRDAG